MPTYKIVRFNFNDGNQVLYTGLSLEDAKEHCEKEWTHGDGWFDGWTQEEDGDDDDD